MSSYPVEGALGSLIDVHGLDGCMARQDGSIERGRPTLAGLWRVLDRFALGWLPPNGVVLRMSEMGRWPQTIAHEDGDLVRSLPDVRTYLPSSTKTYSLLLEQLLDLLVVLGADEAVVRPIVVCQFWSTISALTKDKGDSHAWGPSERSSR
jgi:hypothetical protein